MSKKQAHRQAPKVVEQKPSSRQLVKRIVAMAITILLVLGMLGTIIIGSFSL